MHICQKFLRSKVYERIMAVTGEFHRIRSSFDVKSVKSMEYNFPMYTIGEAATATILEDSSEDCN